MRKVKDFVSRETQKRIVEFTALLLKWNKTINLISTKTISDIASRHILDSLQLLLYIDQLLPAQAGSLVNAYKAD